MPACFGRSSRRKTLTSPPFDICLVLFFTDGVSLGTWDKVGILERELAIYRQLEIHGVQVMFVTYGDSSDLRYAERIPSIPILCNRWHLPARLYSFCLPILHARSLAKANVYKTNQILGAEIALRAARLWRKPLIARCGFLRSEFIEREHGVDSPEARRVRALEHRLFTAADRVVVTTPVMRDALLCRYHVSAERVNVIPNYVRTNLFRPNGDRHHTARRICFVGRLEDQKNVLALLQAIKGLDVELIIVGSGRLSERMQIEAEENGLTVLFLGNVPHGQIPDILRSSELFVLPSHYEGHPKALLEAMACGLPVVGTHVPGIQKLIVQGETGYLCEPSPEGIREAIQHILANGDLRARLGRKAREFVLEHFAVGKIVQKELALLKEIMPE